MDRRQFLRVSAIAGAGAALSPMSSIASSNAASFTPNGGRRARCLWGAHAEPRGNQSARAAIADLEGSIGRRFALSRHYVKWDYELPDSFQTWSVDAGRTPYISWHAETGGGESIRWSSIGEGEHDDWIARQARALRRAGYRMYFCFHHEPENDSEHGGAAEFVAAYSRIRQIFSSHRVSNVRWVVNLMAGTYGGANGGPDAWMPNTFRFCGVDGYNRFPCEGNQWRSFETLFEPAREFARSVDRGLFIGEYGCVERHGGGNDDPDAKPEWFRDAGATIRSWPEVKAVIYSHVFSDRLGCAYWVDTSRRSLEAFAEVGAHPHFN